jgi:hypothetical protein
MAGGNDPTQQTPPAPVVPKPQFPAPVPPEQAQGLVPATVPQAEPETAIAVAEEPAKEKQAYFCLEANHPGQSTPRADHFEMSRMFYVKAGAPAICPLCRKQGAALPVEDATKLPPSLQATKDRLDAAERNR